MNLARTTTPLLDSETASLLTLAALTPPPPGMRITPCTALDLRPRFEIVTHGLIVAAKLDAKQLEGTLSSLIRHKFPRAGARIALRNGIYEFHTPSKFTAETPPVAFTVEEYPDLYNSPTRPELVYHLSPDVDANQPSIHPPPPLAQLFRSSRCPTTFDEFLVPDTPALHVHVAVFEDLTFIGFTSSHILFDSLGRRTLLDAWTRLINGEVIGNIVGMEWDAAPFDDFIRRSAVIPRPGWIVDAAAAKPSQKSGAVSEVARKLVRVPKSFLEDLKCQIREQLTLRRSSKWVGSSDVLLAWWLKMVYGHRSAADTASIDLFYPVNLREMPIFPGASVLTTPYINNAYLGMPTMPLIPISVLRTESLTEIALIIRRAIIAFNADIDGLVDDVQWRCSNPFARLAPSPPDVEFTIQSNCRKSQFGALDFSGACVGEQPSGPVKCFVDVELINSVGITGVVMAEDEDAVWMSQVRTVEDWENIRQSGSVQFV
ncbi:hypothetical protein C8R43DRAFT_902454 [Mycena crocata]|nr:hypothetical protein C8R43DRAFT_902454 [Mycena crocata]